MLKNNRIFFAALLALLGGSLIAQPSNTTIKLEGLGGYTSGGVVPFWLRANQFGSVPLDGASFSLTGSARRDYDTSTGRLFDWGAAVEGRGNLGNGSNLILTEGYGKVRLGIFELRAGRSKKIVGLCDTTLTSGSWSVSGNALGIPEVELAVRDFWTIPWLGELFAFKGNFSHGWMGEVLMNRWFEHDEIIPLQVYLHQKSLYGRFGKPSWRVKLYGGFNHQVQWGNEQEFYTSDFDLTPLETFYYIMSGKRYSQGFIEQTRLGNHMGSIDLGFEYRFDNYLLMLYRQSFFEGGALAKLANIEDGLNGLSLVNRKSDRGTFRWNKLLVEFLYTVSQGGRPWSPVYGSHYEGYYNHGEYIEGWSYKGLGLGSPFVSAKSEVREGLPSAPDEFFINNRLIAIHLGSEGAIGTVNYLARISWSENYGTYWTTDEEQSTGLEDPGQFGLFGTQRQFSGFLELNKDLPSGWNLGLIGAGDTGRLLYNSFGLFIKVSRAFSF